jgi:hypothetical protein
VTVEPPPDAARKPRPSDWLIRATTKGRLAREVWAPLPGVIEERWKARFGKAEIDQLRESLCAVIEQLPFELPECLPILGYGLFTKDRFQLRPASTASHGESPSRPALPVLLAAIEQRWEARFGINTLQEALQNLADDANAPSPLVPRVGSVSRRMACVSPQSSDTPALSHGPAPRRIPRCQLISKNAPGLPIANSQWPIRYDRDIPWVPQAWM